MERMNIMVRSPIILTLLWATLAASGCGERDQTPAIIAAFNHYQAAALAKDGAKAVEAVSQRTFDYYDKALDLALHATSEELNAAPVADRMLAITLRHELAPDEAKSMDGKSVLAWCVEQGWMVSEAEKDSRLENIQIKGDDATAEYVVPDHPIRYPRVFHREGSGSSKQWKNDLVPMFMASVAEIMRNAGAEQSDQENEVIYVGLSLRTKKPLSREIWNPPFPRPVPGDGPKM